MISMFFLCVGVRYVEVSGPSSLKLAVIELLERQLFDLLIMEVGLLTEHFLDSACRLIFFL